MAVAAAEVPVPEEVVGTDTSLINANGNLMDGVGDAAEDVDELDVGLVGKIGMVADLFPDVIPGSLTDGEVKAGGSREHDYEVRIAHGDANAVDGRAVG